MTQLLGNNIDFEQYRPEIQEALKLELQSINEGNLQDALLIKAMALNWSFAQFMRVSRWRGKQWRFTSALSDVALEVQGLGMLRLMTQIVGNNLVSNSIDKAIATILELDRKERQHEGHTLILELISDARREVAEARHEVVGSYWNDIRKVRG